MRVSDSMLFAGVSRRLQSSYAALEKSMNHVSSGRAVDRPSDDPVRFHRGQSASDALEQAKAFKSVGGRAQADLEAADGALANLQNTLIRGTEIAISSASEHWNATMRQNVAIEVDGLYDAVLAVVNTRSNGRYIFAGTSDGQPAFAANGSYLGASDTMDVEIASGIGAQVRFDGSQAFATGSGSILDVLHSLRTALRANDSNGIRQAVDGLASGVDDIARTQAEIGSEAGKVNQSLSATALQIVDLTRFKDAAVAADLPEEASRLSLAQRQLDAVRLSAPHVLNLGMLQLR